MPVVSQLYKERIKQNFESLEYGIFYTLNRLNSPPKIHLASAAVNYFSMLQRPEGPDQRPQLDFRPLP